MHLKRFITMVFAAALMAVACQDYGSKIDDIQKQIDDLNAYCATLNTNAQSLSALIEALQAGDEMVGFTPIAENGTVTGFKATFKNAGEVTVYNQNTGVSVGEDSGRYYWMNNGTWLLDGSGNRIEIAPGKPVPLFVAEDGVLKVSTDGGATWQNLGYVDKALITGITEDEAKVVFTLSSGTTIVMPKYQALTLALEGDDVTIAGGGSVTVAYTVTGADNPTVEVLCGDGWKATVSSSGATGTITVTAPDPITEDKVIVFAGDGQGRMVAVQMRLSIDTTPTHTVLEVDSQVLQVPVSGGRYTVRVTTNADYSVATTASWLHYTGTKAMRSETVAFDVDANSGLSRQASAIITADDVSVEIIFIQEGTEPMLAVAPQQLAFTYEGGSAAVTVVSNVSYSVLTSANWVTAVKGSDNSYTITAAANTGASDRAATVTFSGSGLNATVSVSQTGQPMLVPVNKAVQVDREGGEIVVGLFTNTDYTVVTDASWLQFVGTKAVRTDQLVFFAEINHGDQRTATATISSGIYSTQIVFTQAEEEKYMYLSNDYLDFAHDGGSAVITVYTNVAFNYSCNANWVSVTLTGDNIYYIQVASNSNSATDRSATVTFNGQGVPSVQLDIHQNGNIPMPKASGGKDVFVSTGNFNYRYGPSIIRNSDGSLDMWTTKEGVRYLNSNSDLTYQETGSRTKVSLHGHTIAQYFNTQHRFMRVMVSLYGTGTTADAVTLKLYKWAGSYAATLAAAPLNTLVINNTKELTSSGTRYSVYKDGNHTWMEPGEYMWTATGASEGVGAYKYPGAGTIYLTDSRSYLDGALASDYNFQAKLRGSAYNSSNFVDSFVYYRSTDDGATWSKERDVMYPTEGSEDHYSVCDPGAAHFGGWYYLAYTSAPSKYGGTYNHCYVARSSTPVGPWYKWNGSGWGGEPAKVITFTGTTSQWGAGEPSIVVKDNTVYFYYSWIEGDAEECPTTRLATAPLSENWPGNLTIYGEVIDKTQFGNADSCDIKYVEDCDLFYAFHTYYRYRSNSAVAVWTSPDGKNFTYLGNVQGVIPCLGNMGVSGDGEGHIRFSEPQFIGYSYGGNASANWNTWFGPMSFE